MFQWYSFVSPCRPKTNFQPRKNKIAIARLREEYGKPVYHIRFDEEVSETIVSDSPKTVGKIWHDEVIAFKIDGYLVTYYFTKGKLLARVIKGPRKTPAPPTPMNPD